MQFQKLHRGEQDALAECDWRFQGNVGATKRSSDMVGTVVPVTDKMSEIRVSSISSLVNREVFAYWSIKNQIHKLTKHWRYCHASNACRDQKVQGRYFRISQVDGLVVKLSSVSTVTKRSVSITGVCALLRLQKLRSRKGNSFLQQSRTNSIQSTASAYPK